MIKGPFQGPFFFGIMTRERRGMQFTVREKDSKEPEAALFQSLEPLLNGIGMALIDLNVFHGQRRGGVQVKAVVMAARGSVEKGPTDTGVEDCARAHRLIMPRLELAFPGKDISLEVSSPGIDRLIKDGCEFAHFIGRELRCYRVDISDWTTGILRAADEEKVILETEGGETILSYNTIAKARLGAAAVSKTRRG
jgi:ribosome maturation factor RimP